MNLLASTRSATLLAAAIVVAACATRDLPAKPDQVRIFNLYSTGVEAPLPRILDGCEPRGTVSATAPEYAGQNTGGFKPRELFPALRARAARKSADTVPVFFEPTGLRREPRTLRGAAFRCGSHPLPPELSEPLR